MGVGGGGWEEEIHGEAEVESGAKEEDGQRCLLSAPYSTRRRISFEIKWRALPMQRINSKVSRPSCSKRMQGEPYLQLGHVALHKR